MERTDISVGYDSRNKKMVNTAGLGVWEPAAIHSTDEVWLKTTKTAEIDLIVRGLDALAGLAIAEGARTGSPVNIDPITELREQIGTQNVAKEGFFVHVAEHPSNTPK